MGGDQLRIQAIVLAASLPLFAANYDVGGGASDYSTIQACASAMSNGDTCRVFAGTYNENVTVGDGASGSIRTLTINGSDAVYVYSFTLGSYTKLNGFRIQRPSSPTAASCVTVSSGDSNIEISNNTMYACGEVSIPTSASYVWFHHNTISYPCTTSATAVANQDACRGMDAFGSHMLLENNDFSHYQLAIVASGSYNLFRNNTCHDQYEVEAGSNHHTDCVFSEQTDPTQYMVIEGNTLYNAFGSNAKAFLFQNEVCSGQCFNIIIRYNVISRIGSGAITNDKTWPSIKEYNNTWVSPNKDAGTTFGLTHNSIGPSGTAHLNSIYYYTNSSITDFNPYACESDCNAGDNLYYCTGSCTTFHGKTYGSGTFTGDTGNIAATNPLFTNVSTRDFTLQAGSPAIDAGRHLTTVATADTSTGTSLVVADASYFQDGMGLGAFGVQADQIRIGASTFATILSINYGTNTITLTGSVSRSDGDFVYLYTKSDGVQVLYGSLPDIGALESGSATCTITTASLPNGTQNSAYSQTVAQSDCTSSTWTISAGALPTGLSINGSTGAITGTPTGTGLSSFTVAYDTDTQALGITVDVASPPTIPRSVTGRVSFSGRAQ